MELSRKDLGEALKQLLKLSSRTAVNGITRTVMISCYQDRLELRATNLDRHLSRYFDCPGSADCEICVSLTDMSNLIQGSKKVTVTLTVDNLVVTVAVDDMIVTVQGHDPAGFPPKPEKTYVTVGTFEAPTIARALDFVLPVATSAGAYPNMFALHCAESTLTATDGTRLHHITLPPHQAFSQELNLSIPCATTLRDLAKTLGNDKIVCEVAKKETVRLTCGPWELLADLPYVVYPDYTPFLVPRSEYTVVFDATALKSALKKLQKLCGTRCIAEFVMDHELSIRARTEDATVISIACPVMDFPSGRSCKERHFEANLKYMSDLIVDTNTVTLSMKGKLDPLGFKGDNGEFAVVMPAASLD